jgi:hypothetical protein
MRLADDVTLHFNNNVSTAAVFLDIGKAFDTTWRCGLLHELSELELPTSYIKLIASFFSGRKFKSFGGRRIFYDKKNKGRGASRFHSCPSIVQSTYK